MVEQQVNFLIKASSAISQIQSVETQQILKSYYLLRCTKLTRNSGLPRKHFSHVTRCPHCLLEWRKETERKLTPIKLSKRQRRRIRKLKTKSVNKDYLLGSNIMEKICVFCSHSMKTIGVKPNKSYKPTIENNNGDKNTEIVKKQLEKAAEQNELVESKTNVYCNSNIAFSLSKENTLTSLIKESPKIIKNSKKKKDKLAGLSRAAVIAASKFKQEKDSQHKLRLFLKPAT